ncbi:MAG: transporter, partial [Clostridiales bacterium]|nr:transporter [Clostridiales bacterium]NLU23855.1 transporter [Clostridiales bacterium]
TLGTADFVINVTEAWMTPVTLLALTFAVCAFISFFTGTSWGTYAIMIPIVMPLAFNLAGGQATNLVYAAIAAVMGGGCFGDHCSPLSDTTILSSLGSGSDHVDHVKTQLPYALSVAVLCVIGYVIMGFCF